MSSSAPRPDPENERLEALENLQIMDTAPEEVPRPFTFCRHTMRTEEVLGESPRLLQAPDTDPNTLTEIRSALEEPKPIEVELLTYTKSGKSRWIEMSIDPVIGDEGTCTHFVAIGRDVSARHHRDEQIHLLNRIVHHDLRNDLEST